MYSLFMYGTIKVVSDTPGRTGLLLSRTPADGIAASKIAGQTTNSGWYFKSLQYPYVANQVLFRVSSSVRMVRVGE